jgi:hypothetical protein
MQHKHSAELAEASFKAPWLLPSEAASPVHTFHTKSSVSSLSSSCTSPRVHTLSKKVLTVSCICCARQSLVLMSVSFCTAAVTLRDRSLGVTVLQLKGNGGPQATSWW